MSIKGLTVCPVCKNDPPLRGLPDFDDCCANCLGFGKLAWCGYCQRIQPISSNDKCPICSHEYKDDGKDVHREKCSIRLTITEIIDSETSSIYENPELELPGTFDEFIIAFLIWKRQLEKPLVVADILKRAMV